MKEHLDERKLERNESVIRESTAISLTELTWKGMVAQHILISQGEQTRPSGRWFPWIEFVLKNILGRGKSMVKGSKTAPIGAIR